MYEIKNKGVIGFPTGANYVKVIKEHGDDVVSVTYYQDKEGMVELGGHMANKVLFREQLEVMTEAKTKPAKDPRRADQDARMDVPRGRNVPKPEQDMIDMWMGAVEDDPSVEEQDQPIKKQAKIPVGHSKGSQVKNRGQVKTKIQEGSGEAYLIDDIAEVLATTTIATEDQREIISKLRSDARPVSRTVPDIDIPVGMGEAVDGDELPDADSFASGNFEQEGESPSVQPDSVRKDMTWDEFRDKVKPVSVRKLMGVLKQGMVMTKVTTLGLKVESLTDNEVKGAKYVKSQRALDIEFADGKELFLQDIGDGNVFVSDDYHFYYIE